ncbi:NAD(P)H pyrophosphatase NUDT13, mitochondrial isoform X2 [Cherax quadricarinatus]|uniref:NAD(P)H pyrophosphatase NUDT13, mitochondrial isoform X2 n=1 Tax=Cherax quadricarinatus TaxID=27406 RepID=UPI00387E81C5
MIISSLFRRYLKEQDSVCASHIPGGKFLLYSQSKPLLRIDKANTEDALVWLTYPEVIQYYPQVLSSSILLDVAEDGTPRYSVQVGALPTTTQDKLESTTGATFTDLRLALFMVSWRDAHTLSRANSVLLWNRNNAFCGKCGSPTERNAAGHLRRCSSCNMTHYPSAIPVGIVLVTDPSHQNIVLVRQPRQPPGMYSCIAGFSDVGESLEDTVHREVAEEVGIEVSSVRYVASQHWPFPGSLMAGCFAVAEKQELAIDENELQDARWFSRDEISTAVDRINANPYLRLRGNPSGVLFIPPPGAIAYHLISHWVKGTPVQEIHQHIY